MKPCDSRATRRPAGFRGVTRRRFMADAAATAGFTIVPRYVLGGPGYTPPSDIITRAVIGTGGMGMGHVTPYPQTLAVCDVDRTRLAAAVAKAGGQCEGYTDFRRVLDRQDIDTVHIPTPPHWHALISIAAVQAGKDVLSEKPMCKFIREGRAVTEAVRRYGRVYTINCQPRTHFHQQLRHLVTHGVFGTPITVRLHVSAVDACYGRTNLAPQPVPDTFDYDMWLGPAPYKPYHHARVGFLHRGYWDYGGGALTDRGQHFFDPVQFAIGKEHIGPVEVEADAPWPQHPDAAGGWNSVTVRYEDGTTVLLNSQPLPTGTPFLEGPSGRLPQENSLRTDPPSLADALAGFRPPRLIDFEEAVRTRGQTSQRPDPEAAHRSCSVLHLGNIAIRLGRKLRWNPETERFVDDEEANRFVNVPMRPPWHL